ncbi:Uracil permease [Lachnellula willkommii]|uniref:Uracil permease n=1 Tax=Lachnellula willkommii TaxID=215461 RepID=A0A559M5Y4_9HELO|nr:Uracil permease [Lachnellula willkommii]
MKPLTSWSYVPTKQQLKERCTTIKAWQLPKQKSALAPDHVWTNEDMDPIVVGTTCVAIPMVLNGAIGAKLHIPFSVAIRSSFGYYLAYFCIVSRSILAMFWLGIQGANGAICITVMLTAIWPSYANIPNHIGANQGITTQGMISYFLFWIIQLPLLLIPPTKLRYLFVIKLVAAPVAALATMGWCVHKAGGSGNIFALKATVSGSQKAYLFLSSMSSVTGSWATLACNIPDFSRYARSSKGQFIQLPFLPIIFTLCAVIGIVTTSATGVIYGELIWNPVEIIAKWLDMGHGGRAAAFFAALACGYAVFLAPISGILASDFWLVKRQNIDVPALYNPHGRYHYWNGINWRALLALLVAVSPNLPGLGYAIGTPADATQKNPVHISKGAQHLYTFDWLFGFVTSIVVYVSLSYIFPSPEAFVTETTYGHDVIDGGVSSDVESTGVHNHGHEKDFGNVDAVDIGTEIHLHKREKREAEDTIA